MNSIEINKKMKHQKFKTMKNNQILKIGCNNCRGVFVTDFESFLKKANEIHGDEYEYIESSFTSSQGKISFTCM